MTTALITAPTNESDAKVAAELSHCDRCGALAKARIVLKNGFDLVFCGHHDREYALVIIEKNIPVDTVIPL